MSKVVLGQRPTHFSRKVTVALPEGGTGEITARFKYRTRTDFGALMDEILTAAEVAPSGSDAQDQQLSLAQAMAKSTEANADYLMKCLEGWDLKAEFSRANLLQLCDELPGAAMALMDAYRAACIEGRLGN